MSVHHFDTRVAEKVGLNAAVIAYSIQYWCNHKAANEKDIHEGKAWVYNSMKAWSELLPYLSEKQIRTALDKLQKAGIIESRNLNEKQYDQTRWYAYIGIKTVVSIANRPNGQLELPKKANADALEGKSNCPKGQTNTNNKPNTIPNEEPKSDEASDTMDEIWKVWSEVGKGRTKGKANCVAALKRISKSTDLKVIERAAKHYALMTEAKFHKGLHTWLAGGFWENWVPRSMAPDEPLHEGRTLSEWKNLMRNFVDFGQWESEAGPMPGEDGCLVPEGLIKHWRKAA